MSSNPTDIIAFQGVNGAHSHMACREAYPYMKTMDCQSFEDVFEAVESGKFALGLIPIENSHAGRVAEIHNLLPQYNISIVGEYFHKVSHSFLVKKGAKIEDIKNISSHSQALMQCSEFISGHNLIARPHFDTAGAAKDLAQSGNIEDSAIASSLAAELYGLEILDHDIQNADDNTTLFIAISKDPIDPEPDNNQAIITSILFKTRNISAGLYKALGGFATNNVNLLKIESYMSGGKSESAQFFITFEGHPRQKNVKSALEELGFFTSNVHLLGIYEADSSRLLK